MGALLNDMRPFEWGEASSQAAFRWVFSQPDVDAHVISTRRRRQIDEYLAASGSCPYGLEISELASRTHDVLGHA